MNIAIASGNLTKIRAIKAAFVDVLNNDKDITIVMEDVNSEVSNQPFDEEVKIGAQKRLKNLKAKLSKDSKIDYYVSCEGGIINIFGNYFNVQCVIIEDKNGNSGIGWSQAYQIPNKYITQIKESSLANVLDELFQGKGGIRILSNGVETRENLIKEATIMSLTAINNGEIWIDS